MKRLLAVLAFVTVACGVQSQIPVLATVTVMPVNATQTPSKTVSSIQAHTATPNPTKTPLLTDGCWNIRVADSVSADVVRVSCDELLIVLEVANNGFVRVTDGYICNQAFGTEMECE